MSVLYFAQYIIKPYKSATQPKPNSSNTVWLKITQLNFLPLAKYSSTV